MKTGTVGIVGLGLIGGSFARSVYWSLPKSAETWMRR